MSQGFSANIASSAGFSRATTTNTAASYTAQQWITGAPIALDSDPNSVAPAASRIISVPAFITPMLTQFGSNASGTGALIACCMADGTTASVRIWQRFNDEEIWVPIGGATSLTFATNNLLAFAGPVWSSSQKFFAQVTANNGCTKLAILIR